MNWLYGDSMLFEDVLHTLLLLLSISKLVYIHLAVCGC